MRWANDGCCEFDLRSVRRAGDSKEIYSFRRDESSLLAQQYNLVAVCHHLLSDEEYDESNSGQLSINAEPIYHIWS